MRMHSHCQFLCGMFVVFSPLNSQIILFIIIFFSRYPFEWRNPIGYLIAIIQQYIVTYFCCYFSTLLLCVMIKSLWIFISMARDTKYILMTFNPLNKNRIEILKRISEFTQLHSNAIQLSTWQLRL